MDTNDPTQSRPETNLQMNPKARILGSDDHGDEAPLLGSDSSDASLWRFAVGPTGQRLGRPAVHSATPNQALLTVIALVDAATTRLWDLTAAEHNPVVTDEDTDHLHQESAGDQSVRGCDGYALQACGLGLHLLQTRLTELTLPDEASIDAHALPGIDQLGLVDLLDAATLWSHHIAPDPDNPRLHNTPAADADRRPAGRSLAPVVDQDTGAQLVLELGELARQARSLDY